MRAITVRHLVGTVEGLQEGDVGMLARAARADGSIYATVYSANSDATGVWRFDVDTGEAERMPGTEQIDLPNAIAFDADGTMYVTDSIAGAVWRVPPHGTAEQWLQHELLEGDQSIGFPFPVGANGIALDEASGTVYVVVLEKGGTRTVMRKGPCNSPCSASSRCERLVTVSPTLMVDRYR